ncbi:MAG: hypothetical protein AAF705_22365 [Bacteroidota bacterium]
MNEEKKYEQIQSYLDGSLNETERQAFEQELNQDPDLQADLDLHLLSNDAIELVIEDSLRADLKELQLETKAVKQPAKKGRVVGLRRRMVSLSIAASILLVIGFFGANYQINQYGNQAIAGSFYENELLTTVRGNNNASLLQQGMELFEQGNYQAAVEYFDQVDDSNLQAEAAYAAGHSYYNLGQFPIAAENFATVMDSNDPRYVEKSELFYLISALAADQTDNARFNEVLNQMLENEEHLHHQEALNIQKKLNSFWRKF